VDETALIQDYELTSFSIYGKRDSNGSTYDFKPFLTKLKKYEGETLAQKTENYMLSIGVTETEIYNIRAIMLGKPCKLDVQAQEEFVAKKDTVYKITLNKAAEVSKVEIGGEEVIFAVSGNEIVVQKADLPQGLQNGSVGGLAVIDGMEYPFTFNYDGKNYLSAFPEGDGTMTLDQTYTSVSGSTAIGYDGTVAEVTVVKVEDDSSGGTYFMLGSYGVYVRGGSFRVAVATNGQFAECKPRVEPVYLANTTFKAGISLGLAVTVKDDSTVTLAIYVNGEEKGTCDIARVADELPSEESVFTVSINAQAVTQLIIGKVTPIVSVNAPATFGVSLDEELKIALRGTTEVDKVLIGEAEVNYTVKDGEIVIAKADLPQNLQNGDVSGVVVIGGVEYPFSFTYDGTKYADGLTSGDGTITLTSENTSAAGEKVIGYDGTIAKVTVAKVEDDSNGGTYFMVGSYGVYVRGGSFRAAVMKDGACSEYSPRVQPALLANYTFKAGISLGLAVTIKDDTTVTITVYVNGENAGSCDIPRVSDEIASDQAKFLVQITSYVTSLEISGVKQ
jgi:hypothetical protein